MPLFLLEVLIMAGVSSVSICSNALLSLGDNTINAFSDPTDRARLSNLYETRRNALLRSHPWNCAVKRVILAPDTTTPIFDFSNRFVLPADCLRVLQVGNRYEELDYKIESGAILADTDVLPLRYIWLNDVESSWDAMLIEGMELVMAAAFAYPITQSTSKEQACMEAVKSFLKQARAVDGTEEPPETLGDFRLLTSRYGTNGGIL